MTGTDAITYVHAGRFVDASATADVAACAQDLIAAYVVPGMARLTVGPDGEDSHHMMLRLHAVGSWQVDTEVVRAIVQRHGGSYGGYAAVDITAPLLPAPSTDPVGPEQVLGMTRYYGARAFDAMCAQRGPLPDTPGRTHDDVVAYTRAFTPTTAWAMMRAHALILDLYTRTRAALDDGNAALACGQRLLGQAARDHAAALHAEAALRQVVDLLACAHGLRLLSAAQHDTAVAVLQIDARTGPAPRCLRDQIIGDVEAVGRILTGTVHALVEAVRAVPDLTAEPDEAAGPYPYRQVPASTGPARFIGSDTERQSVGDPGHCEACVSVGHVQAHPELGCGDVGCYDSHDERDGDGVSFSGRLVLTDGSWIECILVEEADGPDGQPQFWIEPVRVLADGEQTDRLEVSFTGPHRSQGAAGLSFRWPGPDQGALHVTVTDAAGVVLDERTIDAQPHCVRED